MDVQEVLKWADELVSAKTGAHLNSLQQAILAGAWDSQKYHEIANDYHCTEANVKRVAGSLWQVISDELDEKVDKKNFRATMERFYISNSNVVDFAQSKFYESRINICGEKWHSDKAAKTRAPSAASTSTSKQPEQRNNLTEAPEGENHNNRHAELTTLKKWILDEKISLVNIFGLPGIGKTTLARELVEQIKDNFDYILWRNCTNTLTLPSLQTNLIEVFSQNQETKSSSLIDYLRLNRCLIILDDFQELFASGEFAGTYLPESVSYGKFLKEMARSPHKSCFLLLSWEKPTEIVTLEGENRHCRSLQPGGLGEAAAEILTNKGLTDENKWGELIQIYGGNPSWLNITASTIKDLCNGSVDRFLSYPSLFLGDLEPILKEYYQRLSPSEKMVIFWLANHEAADIFQKPVELTLSDADFLKAIQSLRKRGLLEKIIDNNRASLFSVPALIKQYVKNR
jgi:DNA replication protein DnaC